MSFLNFTCNTLKYDKIKISILFLVLHVPVDGSEQEDDAIRQRLYLWNWLN